MLSKRTFKSFQIKPFASRRRFIGNARQIGRLAGVLGTRYRFSGKPLVHRPRADTAKAGNLHHTASSVDCFFQGAHFAYPNSEPKVHIMSELKVQASPCDSERMVQINDIRKRFAVRLKNAASKNGIPEWGLGARLAAITGKTAKAASKWLNGESMPSRDSMLLISKALDVPIEWLAHGEGPPPFLKELSAPYMLETPEMPNTARPASNIIYTPEPQRIARSYPLISWVAAGSWAEAPDLYVPGDGFEFLESQENAGLHGYWLEVNGDSMVAPDGPCFYPGYRILVQPEGFDVISNKLYIAKLMDTGETTFKQYVRDAGIEYLKPFNPAFKTIVIDDNIRLIGRVIDAKPPRNLF